MKFPGYPSNREADEQANNHCESGKGLQGRSQAGRPVKRVISWGWKSLAETAGRGMQLYTTILPLYLN